MELHQNNDVEMRDEEMNLASSSKHGHYSQAMAEPSLRHMPDTETRKDPQWDLVRKPSSPTGVKGNGLRPESEVFDHSLTKLADTPRPAKYQALPHATLQTGLVYDVRMRFHVEGLPSAEDVHPEDPRRIHAIFESLVDAGLAWRESTTGPATGFYMGRIPTRKVTKDEVCLVHTEAHWDWVQQLSNKSEEELIDELQHPPHDMDSVYMSPSTPYCAALSAGGAIEACRAVMLGKVKNVFAVIRPPGHHAEREDAKGFCFYDNVSIATKVCQREFGHRCRKVLILDWDVHHGNGIQQANYDDPNVLYISLHMHERGQFYPELSYRDKRGPYGDRFHCGSGAGLGKNVNIPWSKKGMGDADYVYAFQQVVMPIAVDFDPDLVVIAAGFDAAEGDMLGGCKVTPAGYAHMTHMLMSLAQGRVAVCLEGGYNLESIARSATAVARTLMGEPPERLKNLNPSVSGVGDIKSVLRQQSRFWASLYPKEIPTESTPPFGGQRMHDVIRKWQATTLWDDYEMSPLFVLRDRLSKSFENQVLATPNYTEARPLLVILHDPPELITSPDPRTGKIELHDTWLTDIVKTYIDWAVKQGFAVIDVNLPRHAVDDDNPQENQASDTAHRPVLEATQLLTYLWDNYIELSQATHVFLMGTEIGHGAIASFIKANEERVRQLLTKTVSFVHKVTLHSCKSATSDTLAPWYHSKSLVFVAHDHNFWSSDVARKPKKQYGRIYPGTGESLADMLIAHKNAVFDVLLAETADRKLHKKPDPDGPFRVDGVAKTPIGPKKFPPVGNFAISPAFTQTLAGTSSFNGAVTGRDFAAESGDGVRDPRLGSPRKMTWEGNFSQSAR